MGQTNYKNEIEQSRIGSLGSSDAAIVLKVGTDGIGALTDTDKYRLAVMTGQAERVDYKTAAMALGDQIEQTIFNILQKKFPQAQSNPRHEDEQFSKFYGFHILNHIDVEVETADRVIWYEIKASKYDTNEVLSNYEAQLQWHWMMLKKCFCNSGKHLQLHLVHYQTGKTEDFQAANISIREIKENSEIQSAFYGGLLALKDYIPNFKYAKPEEMSIRLVDSEQVQSLREQAENAIVQIKLLEKQIDDWKAALRDYMLDNSIKKIYSDEYSITLTLPSVAQTFDSKRFKTEQPELYSQYLKETERAASVTIKLK